MALDFNTYREIRQQPEVWKKTYGIMLSRKDEIKAFVDKYLKENYEIILTGAGTSAYIGDALVTALVSGEDGVQTSSVSFSAIPYTPVTPTLYLIGDATPNGWSADNATAMKRTGILQA